MECEKFCPLVLFDRENELMCCYECSMKPRKKIPIFCNNKHVLTYVKDKYLSEMCNSCNAPRRCRLVCKKCKPETMFCSACKQTDLRNSCYKGHPYKGIGTVLRECLICRQYKKTFDCTDCNFSVCEACSQ